MQPLTRIVAAVVDTTKAILYKQDGTTLEILQGDARLRPLLEHITPQLNSQGYADVDLSSENSWKEFEEKSSGFRFFKIAKDKLKSFFGADPEVVSPGVIGTLPHAPPAFSGLTPALEEILRHGTSVKDSSFQDDQVAPQRPVVESDGSTPSDRKNWDGKEEHFDKHSETIVAVSPGGTVVPGVERIKSQFSAAAKSGNVKGMEVFLDRLGKVIQNRRHSVSDLLRFMERGDLPVADDGTIIIYKRLFRQGDHYVDPHSRQVKQRVGSYVHMDESLVDPNRRNECSNGLHVARRGYIGSFSGDVIVLAKVRPEDVIAVPDYDANKMRVCGYHIIAELTQPQYLAIIKNRPISDAEGGAELLGNAIAGNHIQVIENVKIRAAQGGDLQITPVVEEKPKSKKVIRRKKKALKKKIKSIKPVKPLEASIAKTDKPVDIKKLVARQKDSSVSLSDDEPSKPLTQADEVTALWEAALAGDKGKAQELLDFKKKAKKGWAVWGLDPSAGDTLKTLIKS